ncbi:MAG: integrase, partial [Alphaproteobacteria bacterium]
MRLSLRTNLPLVAAARALCLLAVYEEKEPGIVDALNKDKLSPQQAQALLNTMLRKELARILEEQDRATPMSDQDLKARIEALEEENQALRRAARNRDWRLVQPALVAAGEEIAIDVRPPISPDLGRRAASLRRQINEAEKDVLEGEDLRVAAAGLLPAGEAKSFDDFLKGEILLADAVESAVRHATSWDMARKMAATGEIALEFWGNIALSTVTTEAVKELMWFIQRIPSLHGKTHGNNRFVKTRRKASKREEIRLADMRDAVLRDEIEADDRLPLAEKRARLAEGLVPRLTMTTVGHHLDRLHAIFRSAQEKLGYRGETRFLTHGQMQRFFRERNDEKADPLFIRKDRPKDRDAWSQERLRNLLLSPLYTGYASEGRRWKPGGQIIRDAKYWVPLLVMTLGTRILEVLQLKKTDLIVRNDVVSLTIGITSEHRVKTSEAKRTLPLPQLLLDLGFVEWVHALPAGQRLLFPAPAEGADIAAISNNFGKQLKTLFRRLGIADWNEDFYALRKTLSSALEDAGVPENRRQAIAGHAGGTTLNRHYTRRNVSILKSELEKFDLKVTVGFSEAHGHPVIEDCGLVAKPEARVEVELGEDETARV